MKKYCVLILVFVLTTLLSSVAFANIPPTGNTSKVGELKQKIINIKQESSEEKEKIKKQIASTTENIKNTRQELKHTIEIKIGKKLDEKKIKIADGFEKIIQNLKDLIVRIESRMSKMATNNIDISSSTPLLENAKTKIALAETELTNLENLLAQNIPTATSTAQINERKNMLKNIKTQNEKTKAAIKTAHKSIVDVINSLKPGLNKKNNSTSTLETDSN